MATFAKKLEAQLRRLELTLRKVFQVRDPGGHLREYRAEVASMSERYRPLALHEEPYDAAARMLGFREGKGREPPALLRTYLDLRETREWLAAAESSAVASGLAETVRIITSYVAANNVPAEGLPDLIRSAHAALTATGGGAPLADAGRQLPAVPVKQSVKPDYLVCLEDGKKLKMLKRHLRTVYGMSPEEYREKWGLPADYPMVSPNYAAARSRLAKSMGLGRSSSGKKSSG